MKRVLPFLIIGFIAIATIVAATLLYRAKQIPTSSKYHPDKNTRAAHILGKVDAPITVEEFGDFQCPPCAALAEPINRLQKDHPNSVQIIFREFPLLTHAHAREAALAAEAAGLQNRFWEMHDLLYREQEEWSNASEARTSFRSYAGKLGLNLKRFDLDLESETVKDRVDEDQKRATSLGVSTTPSIFVNKEPVPPVSLRPDQLRKLVERAIASHPKDE